MTGIKLFASGYCKSHANVANPIEGKGKEKFYATWALVDIPEIGYIMYDSGYSEYFQSATQPLPERIYRWMTPVTLKKSETAKEILKLEGIAVEEIKYIVISHFHADHIAGLRDFPNAQFICAKQAYAETQKLSGLKAVKKGIILRLLPDNFNDRVLLVEEFATKIEQIKYGLNEFQLFDNDDFKLVLLPGHSKDMLGFIYSKGDEQIFFGSDAAWSYDTYNREIFPRKIVKLFFDSWDIYVETQQKIKAFEADNKKFKIMFTHCKQVLKYISNEI